MSDPRGEGRRGDLEFQTTPRLLRIAAERFGDRDFIHDGETKLTFRMLAEAVQTAARAFMAIGVEPGDRVAIWAPNIWEWIVCALGVHSVGGVLVPINTRFKAQEAAYVLSKSRARALLTLSGFLGSDYVDMIRGSGAALPDLRDVVLLRALEASETRAPRAAGGAFSFREISFAAFLAQAQRVPQWVAEERALAVSPNDAADILFTSGTTGRPKGAFATHAQNLRAYRDWSEAVGLRAGDRYLVTAPFFHAFGYKAGWFASLMMGATVLPHAVFDPNAVLERVSRERVTVLPGPPALYQSILLRADLGEHDLGSLRLAVTGAAVIPVALIHRMRREIGFQTIITGYGLTETTGVVSMCCADDDPETIATRSGRPLPGVEVRIAGEDGRDLPAGEPGEVLVRGYNVTPGYFDDPEETARAIDAEGRLHTGDIGFQDARGYLKITDRLKDMFISGGFKAYPAEIESTIAEHPAIAETAVVGVPDERLGEVGRAFVVLKPGRTLDAEELIAFCRERMANFKVPRSVVQVDALPRNASGKVLKHALRARLG